MARDEFFDVNMVLISIGQMVLPRNEGNLGKPGIFGNFFELRLRIYGTIRELSVFIITLLCITTIRDHLSE